MVAPTTAITEAQMSQEWIIDVLADLRQYAIRNYYIGLAEQLDDAIVVAATEIRASAAVEDTGPFSEVPRPEAHVATLSSC